MIRIAAIAILVVLATPAHATQLLSATIITAAAGVTTTPVQMKDGAPQSILLHANFNYGSGGTSADFWVQISVDGGGTWCDVAEFHHLLASLRRVYNLSSLTPVTTVYTCTDGTLANDTAK